MFFAHAVDAFTQNDVDGLCDQEYVDHWDSGAPARNLNGTDYFDNLVLERMLAVIGAHDFGSTPLYLHYTPHVTHNPLQAPKAFLDALNYTSDDENLCQFSVNTSATGAVYPKGPSGNAVACRRTFEAMVAFADYAIGQIVGAIQKRGLWNETLVVWQSDNGGSANLKFGGGNNGILKGSKGSWWEGGMRVAASVSGGWEGLPLSVRGTHLGAMTHTCDWYATLCNIAGGTPSFCSSDPSAEAAGLPGLDSFDLWPLITGVSPNSPRTSFAAGPGTYLSGKWKLLLGEVSDAGWMGPLWPNSSSPLHDISPLVSQCGSRGCLFDVESDPGEHFDLAKEQSAVVDQLLAQLSAEKKTFWRNNETGVCAHNKSLSINSTCACDAAKVVWGGFIGPYQQEPSE